MRVLGGTGQAIPDKGWFTVLRLYNPFFFDKTRSLLQTSQPLPSKNNKRDDLAVNGDGSVDVYFGPAAPPRHEANWIETVRGKSWFTYLRLYGPLDPWFDKTWRPGEIELID